MPDIAIAKPQTDEEPIAFFISMPCRFKKGTDKEPPPIPAKLEITPIPVPHKVVIHALGIG
ncbi:Uncharacterised protein [Vibrio cholerae]|nr:Uncharacterised protein [Vibrio cholerae]